MSDQITVLAGLQYNLGDIIRQTISASFIADYGIVKAVNADKTIDVTHAIQGSYIDGTDAPVTVTSGVEVIFPGSASMAVTWPIAVGDGVLLVGLKNFVKSTKSIVPQNRPEGGKSPITEFPHYSQDTLKAIPLQNIASPGFTFAVDNNHLAQIKNASKSLFTLLDNVESAVQTFSSATSQASLTAGAASSATLATAINALLATMNASFTTARSDLALLLKA